VRLHAEATYRTNMIKEIYSQQRCFQVVSIVVTYNRNVQLLKCLNLLLNQTYETDILIIDNASNDGTEQIIKRQGFFNNRKIHYICLKENTGGSGGFYYGLKFSLGKGWNYFWLMDDDAEPRFDALEKIFKQNIKIDNYVLGSTALNYINGEKKLCFPLKRISNSKTEIIENYDSLLNREFVAWLPFLGFFLNKKIALKVGFPDKNFFIRNDDIEYAERLKRNSIKIYLIKDSIIEHPFQPTISFNIFNRRLFYRSMPAWKMYYEVRNKIIISKRYYNSLQTIRTLAGVSLQVLYSIFSETSKKAYLKAYLSGIIDGIRFSTPPPHKTNGSSAA